MPTQPQQIERSPSRSPEAVEVYCIQPENVHRIWPGRVANMVEKAYTFTDEIMPPDLMAQFQQSFRQLWVVWDGEQIIAAGVTRIIQLKTCKACQIVSAGGGSAQRWKHLITRIEDFARSQGCRKVTIEGRPGWERLFKSYRRTRVVLEKEV